MRSAGHFLHNIKQSRQYQSTWILRKRKIFWKLFCLFWTRMLPVSSNTITSLFLHSHIYLKCKKWLKHRVFLRWEMFLTHLPLLHVFSFSGMKVKRDTTTQSSYSLLFLSAIVWTEDKKCANTAAPAGTRPQWCSHQHQHPYPRQGHPALPLPHSCVHWHSGHCSTPLCAQSQRLPEIRAQPCKEITEQLWTDSAEEVNRKKNCINKTWSYLK